MKCAHVSTLPKIPFSHDASEQLARRLAVAVLDRLDSAGFPDDIPVILRLDAYADASAWRREEASQARAVETPAGPQPIPDCLIVRPGGIYTSEGKRMRGELVMLPIDRKRQSSTYRVSAETIRAYVVATPQATTAQLMACFPGWPAGSMRRMRAEGLEMLRREEQARALRAQAAAEKAARRKEPPPAPAPPPSAPARRVALPSLSAQLTQWAYGRLRQTRAGAEKEATTLEELQRTAPELYRAFVERGIERGQTASTMRRTLAARVTEGKKLVAQARAAEAARRRAR